MIQLQAMRKTVELMDGVLNKAFENGTGEEFSYLDKLDPSLQPPHVRDMLEVMESNDNPQHPGEAFSDAKMGRWLGWAQAAVVAMGLASLEDMNEINRAEPSPSTPTPAALLPCPHCGGDAELTRDYRDDDSRAPRPHYWYTAACGSCGVRIETESTRWWSNSGDGGLEQAEDLRAKAQTIAVWNNRPSPPPSGDVEAQLLARARSEDEGGNEAAADRAMMGMEAAADVWAERVNLNDLIGNLVHVNRLNPNAPTDVREKFIKRQFEQIDALMRQSYLEGWFEGGLSRKAYDVELDNQAAQAITQERELRKAAEGERDEAAKDLGVFLGKAAAEGLRLEGPDPNGDLVPINWRAEAAEGEREAFREKLAETIGKLMLAEQQRDAARAETAQLRKDAVEVVKPFADVTDELFNDWCPDETAAWYRSVDSFDAPSPITVGDFRATRIFLNANDQGTNDGR